MSDGRPSLPEREKRVLAYWEERKIFQKTVEKDGPKGDFVFYEGPPTANGRPGIHHAEARAFKDLFPRYKTMRGYRVARRAGWDTHGLPVELEVEKQLGFTGKAQIEEFGIAPFNERCKESVWTYLEDWRAFTRRLGFWVDLDRPYVTYAPEYVEGLWGVIKKIWDRGLLYQDYRVTPHCPRCGTSLSSHELAQGYADVKDISVYAKFRVKKGTEGTKGMGGDNDEYFVAWTTTPWTLPSNVALAVGEKIAYALVRHGEDLLWMARDLAAKIVPDGEIVREAMGSELVGMAYEPLYKFINKIDLPEFDRMFGQDKSRYFTVLSAEFVTTEDGSGIVHIAPMYGQDDFELAKRNNMASPPHLVGLDGSFIRDVVLYSSDDNRSWFVHNEERGIYFTKANEIVRENLSHRQLILKTELYEHSYPHCWRCKSKVIYYAKDSWYVRMSSLRDQLLAENEKINWEPSHIKDGRFGEWLREVKDWAFSRERYWGTPLPIWICEQCGEKKCIGSFVELKQNSTSSDSFDSSDSSDSSRFDPHRPYVDDVLLACSCGGSMRRVKDVCDVWFDSGAMPYASGEYPGRYPADYIAEAIDQTRGWFYTLLAVSVALGLERPVKNIVCLGHVLDAKGKKMSKSVGNVVNPMEMIDAYGADSVRWYMYTVNQPGESKRFDEKALVEMQRSVFGILDNVAAFYETYAEGGENKKKQETKSPSVLDRWVFARLHQTVGEVTEGLDAYRVTEGARLVGAFIDDLSTWWLRRSRERFKGEDAADKEAALSTLRECLLATAKLLAPFAPFFAEDLYLRIGGERESVHLEDWPVVDAGAIDADALSAMARTRSVVTKLLEARANAGRNVRQPLASATVSLPTGELGAEYVELIKDEVNVKEVVVAKGDYAVELDANLTPALIREGTAREIVRRVNAMRKNGGLTIDDCIEVYVASASPEVDLTLGEHAQTIVSGTLAASLRTTGDAPENAEPFEANGFEMTVGFTKLP